MTKPLRLTQVERKEISDTKMLEVAIDLIVERGTEQLTLKDVGERAGYFKRLSGLSVWQQGGVI